MTYQSSSSTSFAPSPVVSSLRAVIKGNVLAPEDAGYDEARIVFAGGVDPRPAVIVQPADAADVAQTVRLARESGLPFAVRAGGHGPAPYCTADEGVVLDLRSLRGVDIDVEQRTVWAGGGLTAGELTAAVGAHGLAIGFGDTGSVGIGGITLGGGIGYLTRKHGLTIDNLLGVELVTAAGETLQVNAESHPDLFWAVRGGGGNFGVVTRFHYQLQPLPQVVGGMLILPGTAPNVVKVLELANGAPDELSIIANVMVAPPMPFLPASVHGQLVVMLLTCFAGDAAAGERALAPFRALATPLVDMVKPMAYAELFPPEDASYHPTAVGRTMFLDTVDLQAAETILDTLQKSDASMRVMQLRVLGGAVGRVAPDATAFAHRTAPIMAIVAAFYDGPEDKVVRTAWVTAFAQRLQPEETGTYVNFLGPDEGEARVRSAYPGTTWTRLAAIKAKYDPANFFRRNQNVPPVSASAASN